MSENQKRSGQSLLFCKHAMKKLQKAQFWLKKQIGSATLSDSTPPELLPNRKPAASLKPLQLSYSQYSIIFAFYTKETS